MRAVAALMEPQSPAAWPTVHAAHLLLRGQIALGAGALAALLSTPLAFGNTVLMLLAVDFNIDALLTPRRLLASGPDAALWRGSMILDMLGYYLLIIPLVFVLRRWLAQRSPAWADLFTLALLSYSLVGAAGTAIHATVLPPLMSAYAAADVS